MLYYVVYVAQFNALPLYVGYILGISKPDNIIINSIPSKVMSLYLWKVLLRELISDPEEFSTGVSVCEGADAEAVGTVQLPLEELAAHILDLLQL